MTFVGHERLRNKSWVSGEGGRLDGTGNAALEAGVLSIDLYEEPVAVAVLPAVSAAHK
jgi:hypothetical protein